MLSSDQVQSLRVRSSGEIKSSQVYIAYVVLDNNVEKHCMPGCLLPKYHLNGLDIADIDYSRLKCDNLYASLRVRLVNQLQAQSPSLNTI